MRKRYKFLYYYPLFCLFLALPLLVGAVDPTRPPNFTTTAQNLSTFQPSAVTAIYIYPSRRVAVINGQAVSVGDKMGEFTITAISPFTVELIGPANDKQILRLITAIKSRQ